MDGVGQYTLSVSVAALIVGILSVFLDSKSTIGILTRMVCGLFLTFTVIQPLADFQLDDLTAYVQSFGEAGETFAYQGEQEANQALRELIKQETEAYILDKACTYGTELQVQVTVREGESPVPESVRISGNISPYARIQLQQLLEADLGIPKERQLWIG